MASMNINNRLAQKVMVGGVNSPVRAFKAVGGNPLVMERGRGSKLFDINGHSYTDYCLSWGALILGHAHQDVLKAVQKAIKKGVSYGTTTSLKSKSPGLLSNMCHRWIWYVLSIPALKPR